MPKIIFRPNPTPPPFPPPGPVYPANSLKITPYPFESGDECYFEIFNLQQIDDHKNVILKCNVPSEGGSVEIFSMSIDGSPIITSFNGQIDFETADISSFFVEVTKNDDSTYEIPLTLV